MSIARLEHEVTTQGGVTAHSGAADGSRCLRVTHDREKVDLPAAERADLPRSPLAPLAKGY